MIYKLVLVFVIFLNTLIASSDYEWSAEINKKSALVNEAVYIKYTCKFNKDAELYTIDFNPAKTTKEYDLILLKEKNYVYEFILFAKKQDNIKLDFNAIMKKTTLDSIAEMTGGLDDEKAKDGFVSRSVKLPSLSLHVAIADAKLLGHFTMKIKSDEPKVKAFSPYHFEVIINGVGNLQDIQVINLDIKDVKTFTQKPVENLTLTKNGYRGTWSQKFALVSEESFNIKEFDIEYFDLNSLKIKKLKNEELHVEVNAGYKKEGLLDKPEKEETFLYKYLFFFLALLFGFIVGKIFS